MNIKYCASVKHSDLTRPRALAILSALCLPQRLIELTAGSYTIGSVSLQSLDASGATDEAMSLTADEAALCHQYGLVRDHTSLGLGLRCSGHARRRRRRGAVSRPASDRQIAGRPR